MNRTVALHRLGLVDYQECWDQQEVWFKEIIDLKIRNRDLPEPEQVSTQHRLILCEHPHVYTLGKSGKESHLLVDESGLRDIHAKYYKINRGGDITYHGPGQLVGYPILDLDCFFTDIHRYLRTLEEVIIKTLSEYNVVGERYPDYTGVWIDANDPIKARKICAMGVRSSRWVTMHGWAFNINTDLNYFKHIVPCGIDDKAVTSLQHELGREVDMNEVQEKLMRHFQMEFDCTLISKS
jgi:lipoyl(octanoyl) transferase